MAVEEVPATVLNMEFFDRLWKCGVVRKSGHIVKCFDEVCGDFVISDKLREVRVRQVGGEGKREERKKLGVLLASLTAIEPATGELRPL